MKKHYVKPALETVEVMVELGFAQSNMQSAYPANQQIDAYILEDEFYHQTQGDKWVVTTDKWF